MYLPIEINQQAKSFKVFVDMIVEYAGGKQLFDYLSSKYDIYVFSGTIRNFFIGIPSTRDLDLVVDIDSPANIPIGLLFERLRHKTVIRRNKFGGLKYSSRGCDIDIWNMIDTWGLKRKDNRRPSPRALINTVFFNCSAIVFDYNAGKFIFEKSFIDFLRNKRLEVVYKDNPYPESCIVNSFHYAIEYDFTIGDSLKRWIAKHSKEGMDYELPQKKRYGKVLYTQQLIAAFAKICRIKKSYHLVLESDGKKYEIHIDDGMKIESVS